MAPSRTVQAKPPDAPAAKAGGHTERRQRPRAKLRQPIRIRTVNALLGGFEEVATTVNLSRDGVYFTTRRDSYFPGLHVFAVCPYDRSTPVNPADERRAEVVRVDPLPSGLLGVALSFDRNLEVLR